MQPRPPRFEPVRRLGRWLIPAACLGLAPKCALCLLAYAGLGATLGLGGPELCGAAPGAGGPGFWWLAASGLALGFVTLRRRQPQRHGSAAASRAGLEQ